MGSIDKACIAGFLCRLCSEMHRTVIHIYGDQGRKHGLLEKINGYLPITISPSDPLPKTICESCLRRVEQHYELLLHLAQFKEGRYLGGRKKESPQSLPSLIGSLPPNPTPQTTSFQNRNGTNNNENQTEILLNTSENQSIRNSVEVNEVYSSTE